MSNETSLSLLNHLQESPQSESWDQLVVLYGPLIKSWLRNYEVQQSDTDDLIQEVLLTVANEINGFDHNGRRGAFRAWLKGILVNRLRQFWRARDRQPQGKADSDVWQRLNELEDPQSELSQRWNLEHDQSVLRQIMTLAEPNFEPTTWKAFCRIALDGASADEVARELQLSRNAVIVAKCRVLGSLRRQSQGLIESSGGFLANS